MPDLTSCKNTILIPKRNSHSTIRKKSKLQTIHKSNHPTEFNNNPDPQTSTNHPFPRHSAYRQTLPYKTHSKKLFDKRRQIPLALLKMN